MKNISFALSLIALNCAVATAAWAQVPAAQAPSGYLASGISGSGEFSPKSFKLGGFAVTPSVSTSLGRNDNVALQPAAAAVASNFATVSPTLTADAAYRADRYRLGYAGGFTRFASFSSANTNSHELFAEGSNAFTARSSLNWRLGYVDREDPLGSTNYSPASPQAEPDRYAARSASALYGYGAQGAAGRVELGLDLNDKEYKNNRATTASADVASRNLVGRFFYRVAPRTQLLTEYRNTVLDYDTAPLDSTEHRLMAGATWEATAATSGTIKVGHLRKDFDLAGRPDFSGGAWEGSVRWQPRSYSYFDLATGRTTTDPSGTNADYVLTTTHSVAWVHNWTTYLQSNVNYSRANSKYVGAVPGREDQLDTVGLGLNYTFRRGLRAGIEYQYGNRDSSQAAFDYKRNLLAARAEVGF